MRSSTKTLIAALHILAEDVDCADGVANAAIYEAALRLQEINEDLSDAESEADSLIAENAKLLQCIKVLQVDNQVLNTNLIESQQYADRLVQHKDMVCLPKDLENLREANGQLAADVESLTTRLDDSRVEYIHLLQRVKVLQQENAILITNNLELQKRNESLLARTSRNDRRIWL
jgi:chromosome segregation ATPase